MRKGVGCAQAQGRQGKGWQGGQRWQGEGSQDWLLVRILECGSPWRLSAGTVAHARFGKMDTEVYWGIPRRGGDSGACRVSSQAVPHTADQQAISHIFNLFALSTSLAATPPSLGSGAEGYCGPQRPRAGEMQQIDELPPSERRTFGCLGGMGTGAGSRSRRSCPPHQRAPGMRPDRRRLRKSAQTPGSIRVILPRLPGQGDTGTLESSRHR